MLLVSERFKRDESISRMTENLKVMRNKLGLTQGGLAEKVGISRQTLVNMENKNREMSWNIFVALVTVFRAERGTSDLLDHFGIYSADLCRHLTTPKNADSD